MRRRGDRTGEGTDRRDKEELVVEVHIIINYKGAHQVTFKCPPSSPYPHTPAYTPQTASDLCNWFNLINRIKRSNLTTLTSTRERSRNKDLNPRTEFLVVINMRIKVHHKWNIVADANNCSLYTAIFI